MTVEELIKELQEMPPDYIVYGYDDRDGNFELTYTSIGNRVAMILSGTAKQELGRGVEIG